MDTMTPIRPQTARGQARRVLLTVGPAAAAEARTQVQAAIYAFGLAVDVSVAVLLTSELATNAIRHETGRTVALDLTHDDDHFRVDVHDSSRQLPALVHAPVDSEAGRGLLLVASLSDDWGFYQTPAGKAVYFTLPCQLAGDERCGRPRQPGRSAARRADGMR